MRDAQKTSRASIQATPSSIQFGKVVSGVPYSQSVRLLNTGSTDSTNHKGCDIGCGIQRFWTFASDDASGRAKRDVYSGIFIEGQWRRIRRHHGGRRRRDTGTTIDMTATVVADQAGSRQAPRP